MPTVILLLVFAADRGESTTPLHATDRDYRRQLLTSRREVEQTRRFMARQRLPKKDFTPQDRAESWWRLSQSLLDWGSVKEAVRCRQSIVKQWPETERGKATQMWLWENGY
jgi:hypothetical protein